MAGQYLMDYGCMADVAETSTVWSNVLRLYAGTVEAVKARFRQEDGTGYIGCHIPHTYKTGACLYFTFAARQPRGKESKPSGAARAASFRRGLLPRGR